MYYKYHTAKEAIPSNQRRVIEQVKFSYFSLKKALKKQRKKIEDQGKNK